MDRMTKMRIIKPVSETNERVNSQVIIKKNKERLTHFSSSRNYLLQGKDMHGAKYFFKVHASNGFWQILVGKDNSKLFTSNTLFGCHRFTRLPYGYTWCKQYISDEISRVIEVIEEAKNVIITCLSDLVEHY